MQKNSLGSLKLEKIKTQKADQHAGPWFTLSCMGKYMGKKLHCHSQQK